MGPPKHLKLSDLKLGCPPIDVTNQSYEEIGHSFVKEKFDLGYNPDLEWSLGLKLAAKEVEPPYLGSLFFRQIREAFRTVIGDMMEEDSVS
jgi:hypothetical protein